MKLKLQPSACRLLFCLILRLQALRCHRFSFPRFRKRSVQCGRASRHSSPPAFILQTPEALPIPTRIQRCFYPHLSFHIFPKDSFHLPSASSPSVSVYILLRCSNKKMLSLRDLSYFFIKNSEVWRHIC